MAKWTLKLSIITGERNEFVIAYYINQTLFIMFIITGYY